MNSASLSRSSTLWWLLPALVFLLALWVNLSPRRIPPLERYWLKEAVGYSGVPMAGTLYGAVVWNGLEVAVLPPTRTQSGPERARAVADLLTSWLRAGKLVSVDELSGQKIGDDFVISGPSEILRVPGELAGELGVDPKRPELVGEYWVALWKDVILLRQDAPPRFVKLLEQGRPARTPSSPDRAPFLQRLHEMARQLNRERAQGLLDAEQALSPEERRLLIQAARHVPTPEPVKVPALVPSKNR